MAITIHDDCMTLEISGGIIAKARRLVGDHRLAGVLRWDQAITALTITELLAAARDADDPLVAALREELR